MSGADGAGRRTALARWGPVAGWAAFVVGCSSVPGSELPSAPAGTDKLVHLALYAVLGLLAGRAVAAPSAGRYALAALSTLAFGAADEWHQRFVPRRGADRADWLADAVGGTFGTTLAALQRRRELHS